MQGVERLKACAKTPALTRPNSIGHVVSDRPLLVQIGDDGEYAAVVVG
jgi:hypothetical protein